MVCLVTGALPSTIDVKSTPPVISKNILMRVNSTNVQDDGLRIGGIGRRMNSKVKVNQTRHVLR
jgi:hypothetical protein